jgi:quercetin dioxygenase-like cupin family protein
MTDAPPHGPLLVRWEDLEQEVVRPGVTRCAFGTDEVMLVMNELRPGMEVRPHSHDFDQIALVVEGTARFHVDDESYEVPAGALLHIPAGAVHHGEPVGDRRALNLDVFAPPRADYRHLLAWMGDRA